MPNLNLNADNLQIKLTTDDYYVIVKQPQYPVHTIYATNFIGSGATTTTIVNGSEWIIYSPDYAPDILALSGCCTGLTETFNDYTGDTFITLSGITVAGALLQAQTNNLQQAFTGHTSDLSIHYAQSAITINESQVTNLVSDLAGKSDTGHTHTGVYVPFDTSIVSVTGTTTLNATHQNKIIEASGTFTVTLPNSMPTGYRVDIVNVGTGTITLAASTTLQSDGTKLATQYTGASAYHRGSNVWLAVGKLTT